MFAKPAKAECEGAAAPVALPNTLFPAPGPRAAKPDCPRAGDVVDVPAVAQGEALIPSVEETPKVDGFPNVGVEEAGELPMELEPNVGPPVVASAVGALGVPQGDGLDPRAEEPPNAGCAAGEPNAGCVMGAGLAKVGADVAAWA